jgi:7,8-dihydropterin-6-yl-methyl-4-(beta-D-ribofuranosyl)aminobenzene 5'-phosphate synthase
MVSLFFHKEFTMKKLRKIPTWIKVAPIVVLAVLAMVVFVRLQMADAEVQRDLQALKTAEPLVIGETTTLEILPLYEGMASQPDLHSGLGVSYLIKTDTATILFDVGNNPTGASPSPLEQNMAKLGVSLDEVDAIVVSHTHYDHTGGQMWQSKGTFGIGGDAQVPLGNKPIYLPEPLTYPGSDPVVVTSPIKIAEGVATTGAVPFVYPFPAWLVIPQGVEQALVVNVKDRGIVIITGCGHMKVDSLLAHVQTEFNAPVIGIVGGLHEGNASAQALQPDIDLIQAVQPTIVAVSPHDTQATALAAFQQAFPDAYQPLQVGTALNMP